MSLLKRIFGTGAREGTSDADPLIDRIVEATDRRLVFVKGYRSTLRAPVLAARERMREAIAGIPGPIEVSARAWSTDDTIRALFARAADVAPAFSASDAVRAFFATQPASECVALLALEKRERRVLASALHGEAVQAEVARTTMSFAEPQVMAPGIDEAAVRSELAKRALEYLAMRALELMGAMRLQRQDLERERALLTAQLRLASRRGAGFSGIEQPAASRADLERDLARNVEQLEESASRQMLPALLETIVQVLGECDDYLRIAPNAIALDAMNFVVDASLPQATIPHVGILTLARRGEFATVIARFPRSELKAPARLADAKFI